MANRCLNKDTIVGSNCMHLKLSFYDILFDGNIISYLIILIGFEIIKNPQELGFKSFDFGLYFDIYIDLA